MKGTFFSTDFIEDYNGDLRLVEVNTQTAVISTALDFLDYSNFFNVLVENDISELHIIHTPMVHAKMVEHLSASIHENVPSIDLIVEHTNPLNTIYPTIVDDNPNRFILRYSYDESSVFDSVYCKHNLEPLKLFVDRPNPESGSVVSFYHSSSYNGMFDYIDKRFNEDNIPDAVIKMNMESNIPLSFYKIGKTSENQSDSSRWESFINENSTDDTIIQYFNYNSASLNDNKVSSIRSLSIIYGSNLDVIDVGMYKSHATFELPSSIDNEYNESVITNKLHEKHYYEYCTNFIKSAAIDHAGLLSSHEILMSDDTYQPIDSLHIGDHVKSYFIDNTIIVGKYDDDRWHIDGDSLTSGSYMTSSVVVHNISREIPYNTMVELVVDSDSIYTGTSKFFLVYDSVMNEITYKSAVNLDKDVDNFIDLSGSIVDIDEANVFVTNDDTLTLMELDVEDTDTYIISGSTSFNSIVTHNAPCFVAGTKISTPSGLVNIEDVSVGDYILTYNHISEEIEKKTVIEVISKNVPKTVVYEFSSGNKLQCTPDHPIYCSDGYYVAYDYEYATRHHNVLTKRIEIGMEVFLNSGNVDTVVNITESNEPTIVYNLSNVESNHNFFANGVLAHNRGCFIKGTLVSMSDNTTKPIEDIKISDEIVTYDETNTMNDVGIVNGISSHLVDEIIHIIYDDGTKITTTEHHPFRIYNGEWETAGNLKVGDICFSVLNKPIKISNIQREYGKHIVYNLINVSKNHNFYVNGILVHNKL